jgi:hypothetical protein
MHPSQEPRMVANLFKRSPSWHGKWQRRFFVLTDDELLYFKKSTLRKTPRGVIQLRYVAHRNFKLVQHEQTTLSPH